MIADDGHERDFDAALEGLARRLHVRLDDHDNRRIGAGGQIIGELADAARHEDPNIGFTAGRFT